MSNIQLLESLGLFVVREFLSQAECERLRNTVRDAHNKPATIGSVVEGAYKMRVNTDIRKTQIAEVARPIIENLETRLTELKPDLEAHFDMSLSGIQEPEFLLYQEGNFFKAHSDSNERKEAEDFIKDRKLSTVIFLNKQSAAPEREAYGGGNLTFYGLMEGEEWAKYGLPLAAEEGLLVAFPSTVVHEVTPITHGQRYTIVCWYY